MSLSRWLRAVAAALGVVAAFALLMVLIALVQVYFA